LARDEHVSCFSLADKVSVGFVTTITLEFAMEFGDGLSEEVFAE